MMNHFADELIGRVRQLGHPLCVGLDPHLKLIPPLFRRGSMAPRDPQTAVAIGEFLEAVLDQVAGRVAIVKPQIAFFERLGWRGLRMLGDVVAKARDRDLLVLLDAKRGDIGSTASGYADAYLGAEAPLEVNAMTLNPYLGQDSLAPFVRRATENDRGLFVLVKTSNPGSGDFQDQALAEGGGPAFAAVARALADEAEKLRGPTTGWSSLGVVVGATYPGDSEKVRELLPHSLFLVPGYGSQGGSAAAAVRGFVPGPGMLEGGIVNSSRGVLFPPGSDVSETGGWERAIRDAISRGVDELTAAVQDLP